MNLLIKVREKGQITLPLYMREKLNMKKGDLVLAKIVNNTVVLIPQETIDKDQAWFWEERWQKLEAEAESDIQKGRVKIFDSVEGLFDEIEKNTKINKNRKVQEKSS